MDAVVIAGGIPKPEEPLYPFTQGRPKALLEICGKPMIQWVLDALNGAKSIDRVLIAGIDSADGLYCPRLVGCLANQADMLQNIRNGARHFFEMGDASSHMAIVSADIPGLLPEHVDWIINTSMQTDMDIYYNVITKEVMEKRYPGSNRTYAKLKDCQVCGGDMNVVRTKTVLGNEELWEKIIESRKRPFKQAALIGYGSLILFLLRQLTLQSAVSRVANRLHLTGKALMCPYAEVGMDVDKPFQLDLMRNDLANRAAG